MTEHRVARLAMRLFGVYVAFLGLSRLIQLFEVLSFGRFNLEILAVSGGLSSALILLLGVAVFARADALAGFVLGEVREEQAVGRNSPPEQHSALSATNILIVAIAIVGLYLLTQAIVHGFTAAGWALFEPVPPESSPDEVVTFRSGVPEMVRTEAYKTAGYLLTGLLLTWKARPIAKRFDTRSDGESQSRNETAKTPHDPGIDPA